MTVTISRVLSALSRSLPRPRARRPGLPAPDAAAALSATGLGTWRWTSVDQLLHLDAHAAALLGLDRATAFAVDSWMLAVADDERPRLAALLSRPPPGVPAPVDFTFQHQHRDGARKWIRYRGTHGAVADGACQLLGTWEDVSASVSRAPRLHALAYHDGLTGLPNRTALTEQLDQAIERCSETLCSGALLAIEIDHLRCVRETLGQRVLDCLLLEVAQRLARATGHGEVLARTGDDEFAILVGPRTGLPAASPLGARRCAERVLEALSLPFKIDGSELPGAPSIGIALIERADQCAAQLIEHAHIARCAAKRSGRGTYQFFDATLQLQLEQDARLARDLRHAVQRGELSVYFQPVVNDALHIVAAEALVRWRHPQRGMVPPGEFIPIAERSGLILAIGDWVLNAACRQLAQWQRAGQSLTVAVNVSARQFYQEDFVDRVLQALATHDADPHSLKLELTESLMLHEVENVIEKMAALQAHGVGLALDDFGTGYSSLSYLQRLPLNQLKLDKSFVHGMLDSPNVAAIVLTILELGERLKMEVIAEGVETREQHHFLRNAGCSLFQGFLFGAPVPAEDIRCWRIGQSAAGLLGVTA
jgi:diguanylate cyclase (GGDEF)-like protein